MLPGFILAEEIRILLLDKPHAKVDLTVDP